MEKGINRAELPMSKFLREREGTMGLYDRQRGHMCVFSKNALEIKQFVYDGYSSHKNDAIAFFHDDKQYFWMQLVDNGEVNVIQGEDVTVFDDNDVAFEYAVSLLKQYYDEIGLD